MNKSTAEIEADRAVIKKLGGPTKLAEYLFPGQRSAVQRVGNWGRRGIPSSIWLKHLPLFASAESAIARGFVGGSVSDADSGGCIAPS